ncbi:hypothetical protein WR25_15950 [Diploscapter pachys]|uniref:Uncharacterized protein n=1 Tax=Diploscapter pachys TaxID=2018661 RepID=A0A2A2LBF5_9BILA|nr:hypothetical protein WR25_15950 [Diploscapter pachys]
MFIRNGVIEEIDHESLAIQLYSKSKKSRFSIFLGLIFPAILGFLYLLESRLPLFLGIFSIILTILLLHLPIWLMSQMLCQILPVCRIAKKSLQERQAVMFGIGISQSSTQSSLALKINHLFSSIIENFNRFSENLTAQNEEEKQRLMVNFYTAELKHLLESPSDSEKDSNVLLDLLVLQVSESARLLLLNLKLSPISGIFQNSSQIWQAYKGFHKALKQVKEITKLCSTLDGLKSLQKSSPRKPEKSDSKAKLVIGLQEISEGVLENRLTDEEIAEKLRKILSFLTTPKDSEGPTSTDSVKLADSESNDVENEERIYSKPREIVDQVFEGFAVIENSTQKVADFEDDYFSANKRPDPMMMSELKNALKGRAEDMKSREKKALAEFYKVDVEMIDQMLKDEETKNLKEEFEANEKEMANSKEEEEIRQVTRIAPNPADMLAAMAKFNLPQQEILGDASSDDEIYGT